jgi:hypothetical protein
MFTAHSTTLEGGYASIKKKTVLQQAELLALSLVFTRLRNLPTSFKLKLISSSEKP